MKDCLGNVVSAFVPKTLNDLTAKASEKEAYYKSVLINETKLAVRVYNNNGDVIGWNMVPKTK